MNCRLYCSGRIELVSVLQGIQFLAQDMTFHLVHNTMADVARAEAAMFREMRRLADLIRFTQITIHN